MRQVKIDPQELLGAYQAGGFESFDWYLDTHTGQVIMLTDEDVGDLDELPQVEGDESALRVAFEQWVAEEGRDDPHEREMLWVAFQIANDTDGRFLCVPQAESHDGYDDMVDFVDTVDDERLRDLLLVAIQGKGAFRRFKDVLAQFGKPDERQRWFAFRDARELGRLRDWLESVGIEPLGWPQGEREQTEQSA